MRTPAIGVAIAFLLSGPTAPAQWVQTMGPRGDLRVNCFAVSGMNLYAGTAFTGVFLSTNNGTSWTQSVFPGGGSALALAVSGTSLFGGTYDGGIFRSTDNGTSWTVSKPRTTEWPGEAPVSSFAVSGTSIFAGKGMIGGSGIPPPLAGVQLSTNNGVGWMPTVELAGQGEFGVRSLATIGTSLFAGTDAGGVYQLTDGGTNWTAVSEGLPKAPWDTTRLISVSCLALSGSNLFAGTEGGGVYLSTNRGTSWTAVNEGLPMRQWDPRLWTSVDCLTSSGTNLFAGTWDGVFLSTNNGTSWTAVNEGLPPTGSVHALAVSGENLFAGIAVTVGGGVWRRPLSEVTGTQAENQSFPITFRLDQNYPNPFNPSTTIRYSLPNRSHVTLTVFNTLGQQVAQLVNGDLEAGYHEVKFDGSKLASGVYLYKMQAGDFVQAKKFVVLK